VPGSSLPLLQLMLATRTVYLTCLSQEGQWVETIDRGKEEKKKQKTRKSYSNF